MFRGSEQIRYTGEAGCPRHGRGDVIELDVMKPVDNDMAFFQRIPIAHFYVRAFPDSYAGGNFAQFDGLPQTLGKLHGGRLASRSARTHRREGIVYDPITT